MHDNTVDTSVAGFFWTFQRSEAVDFTQGLFPGTIAAIIRRPTKLDVSFRYFYLEFTGYSWLMITIVYLSWMILLTAIFYISYSFAIEKTSLKRSMLFSAFIMSSNICLNAYINKKVSSKNKSVTYKTLLTIIMTLSFIILCHYRAQMNAALNVYVEKYPVSSWEDVDESDYKILTWPDSNLENKFKDSQKSIMRNIYEEKIAPVDYNDQINVIGYQGAISRLVKEKYIVVDILESYLPLEEYPCKIISIRTLT